MRRFDMDDIDVIEFDGVQLPVYRTDEAAARQTSCLNCMWHHLTEEEQEEQMEQIRKVLDQYMPDEDEPESNILDFYDAPPAKEV
jgi:hypothetical protein